MRADLTLVPAGVAAPAKVHLADASWMAQVMEAAAKDSRYIGAREGGEDWLEIRRRQLNLHQGDWYRWVVPGDFLEYLAVCESHDDQARRAVLRIVRVFDPVDYLDRQGYVDACLNRGPHGLSHPMVGRAWLYVW